MRLVIGLALLGLAVAGCSLDTVAPSPTPAGTVTGALSSTPVLPSIPTQMAHREDVSTAAIAPTEMPGREEQPMSLTVVYDNNAYDPGLRTGWGLSVWLEYGAHTLLFDTGGDGAALLDNVSALGLDPAAIDVVVLSHAHDDHTGGLFKLLEVNPRVTVYLPRAFPSRFKLQARSTAAAVIEVDGPLEIVPGVWSTGPMGTDIVEQALVVSTGNGLVVVTGCAHPGVDEMVARAADVARAAPVAQDEIVLVVGGFHLGSAGRERVEQIVGAFRHLGVQQVAPCHCTGEAARALFREAYGDDYHACGAGWQWQGDVAPWQAASEGISPQTGVAAVAVAPSDPRTIYLAAYEPQGLYRSADGGDSWQAAGQGLTGEAPVAIAVHAQDPNVAWAGTMGGGYRTTDGGQQWQPMAGLPDMPLYALAAAADGRTLYAAEEEMGIWRSGDGGQTWAWAGSPGAGASTLSLALRADGVVLAGTAGQGVWIGHNAGQSWQQAAGNLAGAHVSTLAIAPDGRSYALADGRLYLSQDGGARWEEVSPPGFEALSFGLAAGPARSSQLYLGSKGDGVTTSADGGRSWTRTGEGFRHADITCLVGDPAAPGHLFLGTRYNGLYRSDDGGASWVSAGGGIGRPVITALTQDPVDPSTFYAGALDGVYRTDDGGESWSLVSGHAGKILVQSLAVSAAGERVYAGTTSGILLSEDRGATWHWAEQDTGGIAVFALVVDPHDPTRIYAGSWGHNVLRSSDGGQTWAPIHSGLETLSVHALAVDPEDPQILYAGTVEAVYRSADGGRTWQASVPGGRPLTTFSLAVDGREPARVYAATTDGVYLSTDRGRTWQPAGHGSLHVTVTALALAADGSGTLLAGTEHHGLYRSTDGGRSWQPWGLDATSVYTILADRSGRVWLGTDRGLFRNR